MKRGERKGRRGRRRRRKKFGRRPSQIRSDRYRALCFSPPIDSLRSSPGETPHFPIQFIRTDSSTTSIKTKTRIQHQLHHLCPRSIYNRNANPASPTATETPPIMALVRVPSLEALEALAAAALAVPEARGELPVEDGELEIEETDEEDEKMLR